MKLAQIFSVYQHFKMGAKPMAEVVGLCIDSRKVQENEVFIALRG